MLKQSNNIVLYLFTALTAFLVCFAAVQCMELVLKPYAWLTWLLFQMRFEYMPGIGYREARGLFIIGRDCIGVRLFVCLFIMLVYSRVGGRKRPALLREFIAILRLCAVAIALAYALTALRITASVPFCELSGFKLIHTVLSLVVYFGSALGLYAWLRKNGCFLFGHTAASAAHKEDWSV